MRFCEVLDLDYSITVYIFPRICLFCRNIFVAHDNFTLLYICFPRDLLVWCCYPLVILY